MYGYVVPYKDTLRASDFVLYRSFYCGLCCETGKFYGQMPRFSTNYDFAFLSALLHDYARADIVIEERPCVLNPKKKAILQHNPLLERLCAANILLCYQKALDGIGDGDGMKYGIMRRMLKKPFIHAEKVCPEVWKRILLSGEEQRAVERDNTVGVDRAAEPFASLMRDLPELILCGQTDDNLKGLCYNIGKFVYLADALDDISEDKAKKRYNPFIATYGGFSSRKQFIADNRETLEFIFGSVCGRARQCFDGLKFTQSYSLLRNIVFDGMSKKAEELLGSAKKLKPPKI